jgi:hypothetical protein
MNSPERLVSLCILTVGVSLLLVGLVSGTPVRHVVQVIPVGIAFALEARHSSWAPTAALPLFVFWLFIMSLIWLWLLGLARVVTGTFSLTEIGLTLAIGLACVVGCIAALRCRTDRGGLQRTAAFVLFAGLQICAMWVSLQHSIASR